MRPLTRAHLPSVAAIHCSAFGSSALTDLGTGAVRRYYEWQLGGAHDVVPLGAFIDRQLVGFCFGGIFRGAMGGFIRHNRAFLVVQTLRRLPALITRDHRSALRLGIQNLQPAKSGPTGGSSRRSAGRSFAILSIAVDPRFQGRSVGQRLLAVSEDVARREGFGQLHLTVDTDNEQAIRFYEAGGWHRVATSEGWHGSMVKELRG